MTVARTTARVFEDHLRNRTEGAIERDLAENYAEDVVLLCDAGSFVGRHAVRQSAARLADQLPNARFAFDQRLVHGEYAYLTWRATSDDGTAIDGADSFHISDGTIRLQTIHYRLG